MYFPNGVLRDGPLMAIARAFEGPPRPPLQHPPHPNRPAYVPRAQAEEEPTMSWVFEDETAPGDVPLAVVAAPGVEPEPKPQPQAPSPKVAEPKPDPERVSDHEKYFPNGVLRDGPLVAIAGVFEGPPRPQLQHPPYPNYPPHNPPPPEACVAAAARRLRHRRCRARGNGCRCRATRRTAPSSAHVPVQEVTQSGSLQAE